MPFRVFVSVLVMLAGLKLSTAQVPSFPQLAELTDNPQTQFEEHRLLSAAM